MMHRGLSGKVFPIHLKPKNDELLSSWMARLSLAHGLTMRELSVILLPQRGNKGLFNVQDFDLRMKDTLSITLLTTLSEKCATPFGRVGKATLNEYKGRLYDKDYDRHGYSWMTLHDLYPNIHRARRFGMQACPRCLAKDKQPYFRRRWRFAFVVVCPHHKCRLIDRCPACSSPILFHKSFSHLTRNPSIGITACYQCRFDLRAAATQTTAQLEVIEFQEHLVKVSRLSNIKLERAERIETGEYFEQLHQMLTVATHWHPLMHKLKKSIFVYYGLNLAISEFPKKDGVESLEVSRRYHLMWLLHRLLIDDPDRYLQSCPLRDLMRRVWFDRWQQLTFWHSTMTWQEASLPTLTGKHVNADSDSSAAFGKDIVIRPKELERAAVQLFVDGVSIRNVGRILYVDYAGNWIIEHFKSFKGTPAMPNLKRITKR